MVRTVETPGGPARVEAIVSATKEETSMIGLSFPVRLARIGYALLSSAFVACVLLQVFFAGMGAFGADWSLHLTLAHFLGLPPLLIQPPDACRFNPRCVYARDVCREKEPGLTPRKPAAHLARCWATEPGGWIS